MNGSSTEFGGHKIVREDRVWTSLSTAVLSMRDLKVEYSGYLARTREMFCAVVMDRVPRRRSPTRATACVFIVNS